MKSNSDHTGVRNMNSLDFLRHSISQEKETLVSMFLANASITELARQYNVISELSSKISLLHSDPDLNA